MTSSVPAGQSRDESAARDLLRDGTVQGLLRLRQAARQEAVDAPAQSRHPAHREHAAVRASGAVSRARPTPGVAAATAAATTAAAATAAAVTGESGPESRQPQ